MELISPPTSKFRYLFTLYSQSLFNNPNLILISVLFIYDVFINVKLG